MQLFLGAMPIILRLILFSKSRGHLYIIFKLVIPGMHSRSGLLGNTLPWVYSYIYTYNILPS